MTAHETPKESGDRKRCAVCNGLIPDEHNKFDPKAPVYADDYVVHLGCEDELFEWVKTVDDKNATGDTQ